jgi:hypothetical protein
MSARHGVTGVPSNGGDTKTIWFFRVCHHVTTVTYLYRFIDRAFKQGENARVGLIGEPRCQGVTR